MEGGKGTGRECAPLPCPGRIFRLPLPGYFLSPEAAAAGAGVLLVLVLVLALVLEDEDVLLLEDDDVLLEDVPSFFVELYRSEYQPPPFRTKLERLTTLDSEPSAPHAVHAAGAGSEIFCSTSMVFPQLAQAYS